MLFTHPTSLARHEDEVTFLLAELEKTRDKDITALGWLDFFEAFTSLLSVRCMGLEPCLELGSVAGASLTLASALAYPA